MKSFAFQLANTVLALHLLQQNRRKYMDSPAADFHKLYSSVLPAAWFHPQKSIKLEKVVCLVLNTLATKKTFMPVSKDIFPFATFVVE